MQTKKQRQEWLACNPGRMAEYNRKYKANVRHTEKFKRAELNRHLIRKYGITMEQKQELWDKQKGLCAVCGQPFIDIYSRDCQVDHCHDSNTVRGLLHWYCNIMVGVAENHPILIEQVYSYLNDAIVRTQDNENSEKSAEMTDSVLTKHE